MRGGAANLFARDKPGSCTRKAAGRLELGSGKRILSKNVLSVLSLSSVCPQFVLSSPNPRKTSIHAVCSRFLWCVLSVLSRFLPPGRAIPHFHSATLSNRAWCPVNPLCYGKRQPNGKILYLAENRAVSRRAAPGPGKDPQGGVGQGEKNPALGPGKPWSACYASTGKRSALSAAVSQPARTFCGTHYIGCGELARCRRMLACQWPCHLLHKPQSSVAVAMQRNVCLKGQRWVACSIWCAQQSLNALTLCPAACAEGGVLLLSEFCRCSVRCRVLRCVQRRRRCRPVVDPNDAEF